MAQAIRTYNDLLEELKGKASEVTVAKAARTKKEDIVKLSDTLFQNADILNNILDTEDSVSKDLREKATIASENIRQSIGSMFSNLDDKVLKDRSEEGRKKVKGEFNAIRYGIFLGHYEKEADKAKSFIDRNGKEQPIRHPQNKGQKEKGEPGFIKFGSWQKTVRSWNVCTQLIGDIGKFGWENVVKKGIVTPYAETQQWTLDEEGEIVNKKDVPVVPRTAEENLRDIISRLKSALSKVDLTTGKGEELANTIYRLVSVEVSHQLKEKEKRAEQKKVDDKKKKDAVAKGSSVADSVIAE